MKKKSRFEILKSWSAEALTSFHDFKIPRFQDFNIFKIFGDFKIPRFQVFAYFANSSSRFTSSILEILNSWNIEILNSWILEALKSWNLEIQKLSKSWNLEILKFLKSWNLEILKSWDLWGEGGGGQLGKRTRTARKALADS